MHEVPRAVRLTETGTAIVAAHSAGRGDMELLNRDRVSAPPDESN